MTPPCPLPADSGDPALLCARALCPPTTMPTARLRPTHTQLGLVSTLPRSLWRQDCVEPGEEELRLPRSTHMGAQPRTLRTHNPTSQCQHRNLGDS